MTTRTKRDPYERFMEKVEIDEKTGCWLWGGYKDKAGYGYFSVGGKKYKATRWILARKLGRELAADEVARHKCHTPACVSPSHLVPGTRSDNAQDMVKAGRARRGPHSDCGHENTKYAREKCRKVNGVKQARHGGMSDYDRFMKYVDTEKTPDGCHPWTGYVNEYGRFGVTENGRQRKVLATRWLMGHLRGKELTQDEVVLHLCDNPVCVRREHLRVGTHAENMADMAKKGRGYKGKTHCKRGHPFDAENTRISPSTGFRHCRACWVVRREEKAARSTPSEP